MLMFRLTRTLDDNTTFSRVYYSIDRRHVVLEADELRGAAGLAKLREIFNRGRIILFPEFLFDSTVPVLEGHVGVATIKDLDLTVDKIKVYDSNIYLAPGSYSFKLSDLAFHVEITEVADPDPTA